MHYCSRSMPFTFIFTYFWAVWLVLHSLLELWLPITQKTKELHFSLWTREDGKIYKYLFKITSYKEKVMNITVALHLSGHCCLVLPLCEIIFCNLLSWLKWIMHVNHDSIWSVQKSGLIPLLSYDCLMIWVFNLFETRVLHHWFFFPVK